MEVGAAKAKVVELPSDPALRRQAVRQGVDAAVERLKLTPLGLFNLANKRKRKFLDRDDVAAALHQLTKFDLAARGESGGGGCGDDSTALNDIMAVSRRMGATLWLAIILILHCGGVARS